MISTGPAVNADELSNTGDFIDGVAAIVNEGVVLKSQLRDRIANIIQTAGQQNIPLPPANVLQDQVLERLIVDEIQLQRAERIGLQISDQMVNEAVAQVAATNQVTIEQMPELLLRDGIIYAEWRESIRDELTLEQLRRIDVGQRIAVAPREIEQCIADLENNVVANSAYDLSLILMSLPEAPTSAQIEEVEQQMAEVYAQIEAGSDFREMAIRYSQAPNALEGGSLGWLEGEQVPTVFVDVLPTMGKGDVSEPYRYNNNYYIVKVNELRSAIQRSEIDQVKARHILVTPNEIIDDATAKQRLDDALKRIEDGEDFGEIAKLLSDDPGSAQLGGDLGWAGPGTFVGPFQDMVDTLETGVVSEPFRSQFGWHIVEVLERRVYDNTEDLKRRNCDARIRNDKMEEETQLWIRRLRDEAYVDKRV